MGRRQNWVPTDQESVQRLADEDVRVCAVLTGPIEQVVVVQTQRVEHVAGQRPNEATPGQLGDVIDGTVASKGPHAHSS